MDLHSYYEPPPDYSDSDSDSELRCKSLNPILFRSDYQKAPVRLSSTSSFLFSSSTLMGSARSAPIDEAARDVQEIVVPSSLNIPRSNWTLQKRRIGERMEAPVRTASISIGNYKAAPRDPIQQRNELFESIRNRMQAHVEPTQVQQAPKTNLAPVHKQPAIPPPPPPPPPMPPITTAVKNGVSNGQTSAPIRGSNIIKVSINGQLAQTENAPIVTQKLTETENELPKGLRVQNGQTPVTPKPVPRRSMSVKSVSNPFNPDTMKPLINEFRFYQKTHKNILGQKSELQKVIEKRQQAQKVKQIEEEQSKSSNGLGKIFELRAMKSNPNGSVPVQLKQFETENNENQRNFTVLNGTADVSEKCVIKIGSSGPIAEPKTEHRSAEVGGQVKLILKSIESKNQQTSGASAGKFKRLEFNGRQWPPANNLV